MDNHITVNGETRSLSGAENLDALLTELGIDPRKVAVELNLEIVPRSKYQATKVSDGDKLEVAGDPLRPLLGKIEEELI